MRKPDNSVDKAFADLEERYGQPLNAARRIAISNNLSAFFSILNEWDMKQSETEEEETLDTP